MLTLVYVCWRPNACVGRSLLDESPRWLVVRGRHAEALEIIRKAARINKAYFPDDFQFCEMDEVGVVGAHKHSDCIYLTSILQIAGNQINSTRKFLCGAFANIYILTSVICRVRIGRQVAHLGPWWTIYNYKEANLCVRLRGRPSLCTQMNTHTSTDPTLNGHMH